MKATVFVASSGNDIQLGSAGNDTLSGGAGGDALFGDYFDDWENYLAGSGSGSGTGSGFRASAAALRPFSTTTLKVVPAKICSSAAWAMTP